MRIDKYHADEIAKGEAIYNFDTQKAIVEEMPGMSVFYKDSDGAVYRT